MMIKTRTPRPGLPDETGELQAALAVRASLNSWLEAQDAQASGAIAPGVTTDGSLAAFKD